MLTDRVIDELNEQIERELRSYRSSWDDDEKLGCLDRIARLKAILNPETVTIVTVEAEVETEEITLTDALIELVKNRKKR